MVTFYNSEAEARADAQALGLREKVLCFVYHGQSVLVFDHADVPDAGVQVPAGGVEAGETPAEAARRELWEESGLTLSTPHFLAAYRWEAQTPSADFVRFPATQNPTGYPSISRNPHFSCSLCSD